ERASALAVAPTTTAGALVIPQLHAELGGEPLHGLRERQVVDLHDEGDDVAALSTAEAVPRPNGRPHVEGRCLLVVERAESLQGAGPDRTSTGLHSSHVKSSSA